MIFLAGEKHAKAKNDFMSWDALVWTLGSKFRGGKTTAQNVPVPIEAHLCADPAQGGVHPVRGNRRHSVCRNVILAVYPQTKKIRANATATRHPNG